MRYLKIGFLTLSILTGIIAGGVQAQGDDHHTIGIVMFSAQLEPTVEPFLNRLAELDYFDEDMADLWAELLDTRIVERETITIIFPPAIGEEMETVPTIVQSMIDSEVDVIFTPTQEEAVRVQAVNDQIPIVFAAGADPVGAGLIESLNEPGGSVTGIVTMDSDARRLQLLVEIDPTIQRVFYAYNPSNTVAVDALAGLTEISEPLDLELVTMEFSDQAGVIEATRNVPDDIDVIFLSNDLENFEMPVVMGWVGASTRLQAGISIPVYTEVPAILMGYGPDLEANSINAAGLVDQILHGADPAVMPVLNSEYGLMVNLVVAESLGIEVSRNVLRQASMIIRTDD